MNAYDRFRAVGEVGGDLVEEAAADGDVSDAENRGLADECRAGGEALKGQNPGINASDKPESKKKK